jgi:hypothetical protein
MEKCIIMENNGNNYMIMQPPASWVRLIRESF